MAPTRAQSHQSHHSDAGLQILHLPPNPPIHQGPQSPPSPPGSPSPQNTGRPIEIGVGVDHCVGCLACADVCAPGALHLLPGTWAVTADADRCTACRRCVPACPFGAITVTGTPRNRHRVIVDSLSAALGSGCPGGWQVTDPGPGFRPAYGAPPIVPDVAVVRAVPVGPAWLTPDDDLTVPLVVDVVTARTTQHDLDVQRDAYWRCGVGAYWTVHQQTGRVDVQWSRRPAWFDRWSGLVYG